VCSGAGVKGRTKGMKVVEMKEQSRIWSGIWKKV